MHKKYYFYETLYLLQCCSLVRYFWPESREKEEKKQVNQRGWKVQQGHSSSSTVSTSPDPHHVSLTLEVRACQCVAV